MSYYVVFYKLFDDASYFSNRRTWNFAIFWQYNSSIIKLKTEKNVLTETHKKGKYSRVFKEKRNPRFEYKFKRTKT